MVKSRFADERTPRATRVFTNREEPIATFERVLASINGKTPRVVSYYGVGGVGKSRLCRELMRRLNQSDGGPQISCLIDFAIPTLRDPLESLLLIRRATGSRCILFDFAVLRWWAELGRPAGELRGKLGSKPEGLLGEFLMFGVTTGSDLALGTGIIPSYAFLSDVADRAKWAIRRTLSAQRVQLERIEQLTIRELSEMLPYFLGTDLSREHAGDVALFFDTYEHLWLNPQGELRQRDALTDQWVRDLLAPARGVAAFVFGRRRLGWDEIPGEGWGDALEEHLLGALSSEDARAFLVAADVGSKRIREHIVKVANGLPLILDVCLDIYEDLVHAGSRITIASFGRTHDQVLERVLQHLPLPARETAILLAVPRSFDRELFAHLIRTFRTGFPETALETILDYSFLTIDKPTGRARFHELMRDHILQGTDPALRQDVATAVVDFWMRKELRSWAEWLMALDEVLYLRVEGARVNEWFFDLARSLCNAGYWHDLQVILRRSEVAAGERGTRSTLASLFEAVCERRLRSATNALANLEILSWEDLNKRQEGYARFEYGDMIRLSGRFDEALSIYETISDEASYDRSDRVRAGLQAGDVLTLKGRFQTAMQRIEMIEAETTLERVAALRQRGHVFRFQLQLDLANEYYAKALEIAQKELLVGFVGKLLTNVLEAGALRLVGRDSDLEEEALRVNHAVNSPVELGKCHAARGLGVVLTSGDSAAAAVDFTKAQILFEEAGYEGGKAILAWYRGMAFRATGNDAGFKQAQAELERRTHAMNVYHFLPVYLRGGAATDSDDPYEWVDAQATDRHLRLLARRIEDLAFLHDRPSP